MLWCSLLHMIKQYKRKHNISYITTHPIIKINEKKKEKKEKLKKKDKKKKKHEKKGMHCRLLL